METKEDRTYLVAGEMWKVLLVRDGLVLFGIVSDPQEKLTPSHKGGKTTLARFKEKAEAEVVCA